MPSIFGNNKPTTGIFGGKTPKSSLFPKSKTGDRALETEGSNLEKAMSFLSRTGAPSKQFLINLAQGNPAGQDIEAELHGEKPVPTGSDVIQAFRGTSQLPDSKLGRAALAVGGFLGDVVNPGDPLNWIGVGELTKAGKAAQATGDLAKFTEGLQNGERSFLAMRAPFTKTAIPLLPDFGSKVAGSLLEGTGKAFKAIPGVQQTLDFMKPQFNKLRQYTNIATSKAANIFNAESLASKADTWKGLRKEATNSIKAGELDKTNPAMADHYKSMGLKPEEIVDSEIKRSLDKPIAERGLSATAAPAVKEFVTKIPVAGPSVPAVEKLADLQRGTIQRLGVRSASMGLNGSLGEFFGAPRIISQETKNAISKAGGEGINGSGGRAQRVFTDLTQGQIEAAQRDPQMRAQLFDRLLGDKVKKNPNVLDMFKTGDPQAASFYEQNTQKAFGKYLENKSRQISTGETVGQMMKDPTIARASRADFGTTPAVRVDIPKEFQTIMGHLKQSGENVNLGHMYMTPETAHEFKNFIGLMTHEDQMNHAWGFIQTIIKPLVSATNLFKRITLLAPPGTFPFMSRNIMSNGMQSAMAGPTYIGHVAGRPEIFMGATSPSGAKAALYLGNILRKAGDNPAKFAELASKAGEQFGLDLGKELATMKDANLFNEGFTKEMFGKGLSKAERMIGIGISGKANELVENVFRIQHYITRRLQGWTPQAAIDDVRKYLYDYMGGISPQLQKLKVAFPFLSWTRLNVPVMMEHILTRPGKFAIPQRAKENIEATIGRGPNGEKPDERALDEYIKGDWHIRLNYDQKTGKWNYLRLKNTIPSADLEDFTSISRFVDMMESSLSPFIKTSLENNFNQSMFFKTAGGEPSKIENYPGETGKFFGQDVQKKTLNWLRDIRPLNMINTLMGEPADTVAANIGGISVKPIDLNKATDFAKLAYARRKQDLMISKKHAQNRGSSTGPIDALLQKLNDESYVPGSGQ